MRPPPEVLDRLGATGRDLHVTLRFLGAVADELVAEVADALRSGLLGVGPAEATVGTRIRRLGPTALVVDVAGLDPLAAAVRAAVGRFGGDDRPFQGHLTLARRRRGAPGDPVAPPPPAPVRWRVTEVALVRSDLGKGPGGTARHSDVAAVVLGERP